MKDFSLTPIPFHIGYFASEDGGIYNRKGHRLHPNRLGKYYAVSLPVGEGKFKPFTIHRLVAITFIPNPFEYPQVNHKDGNTANNAVKNLEWCTASQNQLHRFHVLKHGDMAGEKNPAAKLTEEIVLQMRKSRSEGLSYSKIAKMYNVSIGTAHSVVNGTTWKCVPLLNIIPDSFS